METKNVHKEVKFPENLKINSKLKRGDRIIIAEYAGYNPASIRDMMLGFRRITDKVNKAVIRLLEEREADNNRVKELVQE